MLGSKLSRQQRRQNSSLREVDWTDEDGRIWKVGLPEGVLDSEARQGIEIGPPSLDGLGLPLEVEVRLHNQLHARRLFTFRDVRGRRQDVFGALQAALKVDTGRIVELYTE